MLAAASVGRRRRELRHGRPLASRRLWERQRAVGKRRRIRRRRRRTRTARRPYHQSPACESTSRVGRSLAVNSRPALAQRQQSRRPQTGGRADPDTHTHTHTHTQHNKKTPGLVKRRAARAPARRPSQAPCRHALRTAPRAAARRRAQRGPRRATDRLRGGPAAAAALRSGGDDLLRP
ncbi:unnamed protein product [Prorocentrum cordatum]|uniref:Uncharacterized protein n=1 Tax=Prorocentrum cordatum TaxID=2364126 RepID=A0ABN9XGD8_9DINO|nr:unnamed protein product [Polarella glacialis]